MASKNRIKECVPELQTKYPKMKKTFEDAWPGWMMKITCGHRPPEHQFEIYKCGREKNPQTGNWRLVDKSKRRTNCDGFVKLSNHNFFPSRALDIAIRNPTNDFVWSNKIPQWQYMIRLAEIYSLTNGGSWGWDLCHFEIS